MFHPPTPSKGRVNVIGTILKSKYGFFKKNVEKKYKEEEEIYANPE